MKTIDDLSEDIESIKVLCGNMYGQYFEKLSKFKQLIDAAEACSATQPVQAQAVLPEAVSLSQDKEVVGENLLCQQQHASPSIFVKSADPIPHNTDVCPEATKQDDERHQQPVVSVIPDAQPVIPEANIEAVQLLTRKKQEVYDPLNEARLFARFDYRQTPSWINLLQVERQRVKYSDILPSLKRLGVIKNNSGSKRMFTFNQTPNGKLTVIFYHEPYPDDGRGMEDPCYVTPLVDGFMRAGYTW